MTRTVGGPVALDHRQLLLEKTDMPLHVLYPPLLGYHPALAGVLIGLMIVGAVCDIAFSRKR
jgi:hypothetical protein